MELSIRGRHLELTEPLKTYAERRLRFAVGAFESRIDGIDVRVADLNGRRGDKACRMTAALFSLGRVVARATAVNAYHAIDRAAARLRAVVVKRLRRRAPHRQVGRVYQVTPRHERRARYRRCHRDG